MRLIAPDMEPTLVEQKLNRAPRTIPEKSHTNEYKFSYDKEFMI